MRAELGVKLVLEAKARLPCNTPLGVVRGRGRSDGGRGISKVSSNALGGVAPSPRAASARGGRSRVTTGHSGRVQVDLPLGARRVVALVAALAGGDDHRFLPVQPQDHRAVLGERPSGASLYPTRTASPAA